ncbi:MAG TPA: helix-hairpin-helix domain-containing protein [Methylomirabilota bacterium]|jgi:competence protein ComEA|nr:helix-hairpin-helix domain-containing protein [Methylomirabilota bacterium]
MALHTRRQLVLLLSLLGAATIGLAVREWRAAYPELAERLEQFDREPEGREGARETSPPPGRAASGRLHATTDKVGRSAAEHRVEPAEPVDLNRATTEDLARLPGVGPVLATRIVTTREADGRFGSVEELKKVKGLGRSRLERLRALVTVTE